MVEFLEKKVFLMFSSHCPLQILALKNCNQDITKDIIARVFKLDTG